MRYSKIDFPSRLSVQMAGVGAGGGGAFSPTDISGLLVWYDASDSSTLWEDSAGTTPATNGNPVGKWDDKSGNTNNATQATTSNKPLYVSTVPAVRGDGTNDFMSLTSSLDVVPGTIFIVSRHNDADEGYMIGYSVTTGGFEFAAGTANVTFFTTTILLTGNATDTSVTRIYMAQAAATNDAALYSGGGTALVTDTSHSNDTTAFNRLFARLSGTTPLDGDISEIIVYDSKLSVADSNTVGDYLADKWSLTWSAIS